MATSSRLFFLDIRTGEKTPLAKTLVVSGVNFAASRNGRMLAYAGIDDEGEPQIFIARIDGTRVRQMTRDPKGATWPAWSPDGTMIAYESGAGKGGFRNLFVLEVATSKFTQVTKGSHVGGLQFAPDGSSLVYTGGRWSAPELRIVPVAGGQSRLLIALDEGLEYTADGSLSPDGSLVTFLGGGSPTSEGHCGPCRLMANAEGSERRVVTEDVGDRILREHGRLTGVGSLARATGATSSSSTSRRNTLRGCQTALARYGSTITPCSSRADGLCGLHVGASLSSSWSQASSHWRLGGPSLRTTAGSFWATPPSCCSSSSCDVGGQEVTTLWQLSDTDASEG